MISVWFWLVLASPAWHATDGGSVSRLVEIVIQLHGYSWDELSMEAVRQLVTLPLVQTSAPIPAESKYHLGPCDGTDYLVMIKPGCSLRLEFDQVPAGGQVCRTRLRAVHLSVTGASRDINAARVQMIAGLQAAGEIGDEFGEYRWRSDDSRAMFVLTTAVSAPTRKQARATLNVKLRHIFVIPEMLDALPFHKGYFPPVCEK